MSNKSLISKLSKNGFNKRSEDEKKLKKKFEKSNEF